MIKTIHENYRKYTYKNNHFIHRYDVIRDNAYNTIQQVMFAIRINPYLILRTKIHVMDYNTDTVTI